MPLPALFGGIGLFRLVAAKAVPLVLDLMIEAAEDVVENTDNDLDDNVIAVVKQTKELLVDGILKKVL